MIHPGCSMKRSPQIQRDMSSLPIYNDVTNFCQDNQRACHLANILTRNYPPVIIRGIPVMHELEIFMSPVYNRKKAENFFFYMCTHNHEGNVDHLLLFASYLKIRFGCGIHELSCVLHPMMFTTIRGAWHRIKFTGFCENCVEDSRRNNTFFTPIARRRDIQIYNERWINSVSSPIHPRNLMDTFNELDEDADENHIFGVPISPLFDDTIQVKAENTKE